VNLPGLAHKCICLAAMGCECSSPDDKLLEEKDPADVAVDDAGTSILGNQLRASLDSLQKPSKTEGEVSGNAKANFSPLDAHLYASAPCIDRLSSTTYSDNESSWPSPAASPGRRKKRAAEPGSGSPKSEPSVSAMSPRNPHPRRRSSQRPKLRRQPSETMSITAETAATPSESLQYIIENSGKMEDFYTCEKRTLGKGSFGVVRKATVNASGAQRAIKTIEKKSLKNAAPVIDEIQMLKLVDHMHIVKLYETFEDEDFLHLVMALSTHGDLKKYVLDQGHLSYTKTKSAMRDLVSAINYLHRHFIVHRDVKPHNLLVHQTLPLSLRLTDFGIARRFRPHQIFTADVGSPCFMAPEVYKKNYTQVCDVWSCGVIMYFLVCGELPFQGKNDEEIKASVLKQPPPYQGAVWADVSKDTWTFLDLMLQKNPRARYTADQAFHHDWIKPLQLKSTRKEKPAELSMEMLQQLRTFRKGNKLKRSALIVLASMLKTMDVYYVHKVFVSLDLNGDGQISLPEMTEHLRSKMGDSEVAQMFEDDVTQNAFDVDEDDVDAKPFSYTEFIAATFDRKKCVTPATSKAAFAGYDKEGSGKISMRSLACGKLLGDLSMEEMALMLAELDMNGDSFIDMDEFHAMLMA